MRLCTVLALAVAGVIVGCQRGEPGPVTLKPEAFLQPSTLQRGENTRATAIDQPGAVNYDTVRLDLLAPQQDAKAAAPQEPMTTLPPSVARLVPSPAPVSAPLPPLGEGVAAVIGRVVVEVNGEPIYSQKVLGPIEPDLAARAKEADPETFKKLAAREIKSQIDSLIRAALEVAAARKNLSAQDLAMAEQRTMIWRQEQITQAGGSVELARQKAAAEGISFEEKVQDEYRANIVRFFYAKKIFPRVQVRAEDMRRYYDRNKDKEFTDRAAIGFRLIKVDIKKVGDRSMALSKADELVARARKGEDFATLAREYNDDSRLRGNGGDMGMIDRGAFAKAEVENALWKAGPGEVVGPVEDAGAFYIAKVEQKKDGRVRSFDEESVQDDIREKLKNEQLVALRDRQREQLMQGAVVNPYPPPIDPLVEIVMQKYPGWAMK